MKKETEITVMVTCSYEKIHNELIKSNFKIIETYEMTDVYMINKDTDMSLQTLELLKKCILVRSIDDIKKFLLYKYKKYADNGDILEQGKMECPIIDIDKGILFMKAIDYEELFKIYDKNIIYSDGKIELDVQLVNDKYIFIEVEANNNETVEELINILNSYDLSFDKSNYFVKKAQIIFEESKK